MHLEITRKPRKSPENKKKLTSKRPRHGFSPSQRAFCSGAPRHDLGSGLFECRHRPATERENVEKSGCCFFWGAMGPPQKKYPKKPYWFRSKKKYPKNYKNSSYCMVKGKYIGPKPVVPFGVFFFDPKKLFGCCEVTFFSGFLRVFFLRFWGFLGFCFHTTYFFFQVFFFWGGE